MKPLLCLGWLALAGCIDFGSPEGRKDLTVVAADTVVTRGSTSQVPITVQRTTYLSEDVVIELVTPPAGVSAAALTMAATANAGMLVVQATSDAALGPLDLQVRAVAREAKLIKTARFVLTIQ